ncbi:winged helix-turn-helix domain-containing protein [Holospora obtusa]|uniref:winged helix-turn-helix domain-containing protein n=1 Tax=Holospora obtusa TaxID=49893 RepID=UPI0004186169|nr:helix-turn-helix domain-containing protein [Holospora obtusa]
MFFGDIYWCSLWREVVDQNFFDLEVFFCEKQEQLNFFREERSVLSYVYVQNKQCVFENWISKKYYLLPEFFFVFLGELKILQNKVGYALEDFLLYDHTIITKKKELIVLREKEHKILIYFLNQYQKKVNKEKILKEVWNYHHMVETSTLETHVGQLNKKLRFCNHRIIRYQDNFFLDSYISS